MEFTNVKVLAQGGLVSRDWKNEKGEIKVIRSVELRFTNGIDTVVGEVSDNLADEISRLNLVGLWVSVSGVFSVSNWKTQQGTEACSLRYRINKLKTW